MQRWEYCVVEWSQFAFEERNEFDDFSGWEVTYFKFLGAHAEGKPREASETPDPLITALGLRGWEMISISEKVSSYTDADGILKITSLASYYFKRPFHDSAFESLVEEYINQQKDRSAETKRFVDSIMPTLFPKQE